MPAWPWPVMKGQQGFLRARRVSGLEQREGAFVPVCVLTGSFWLFCWKWAAET